MPNETAERTFFTVYALAAIRSADDLDAAEKLVLVMLTSHANELGHAWPSVPTLVAETKLSRRAVYRALAKLEAGGWLVRRHPATHPGTVYDLRGLSCRAEGVPGRHPGVHQVHGGVPPLHQTGAPEAQGGAPEAPKEIMKKSRTARAPARRLRACDQSPEQVKSFLQRLDTRMP